jgi:hypothetical protein
VKLVEEHGRLMDRVGGGLRPAAKQQQRSAVLDHDGAGFGRRKCPHRNRTRPVASGQIEAPQIIESSIGGGTAAEHEHGPIGMEAGGVRTSLRYVPRVLHRLILLQHVPEKIQSSHPYSHHNDEPFKRIAAAEQPVQSTHRSRRQPVPLCANQLARLHVAVRRQMQHDVLYDILGQQLDRHF